MRRGYADLPQATTGSPLYVLEFERSDDRAAATTSRTYSAWSTAGPCSIVFAAAEGCYATFDMLGERRSVGTVCTRLGTLRVDNVTDAPLIVAHHSKSVGGL